MLFGMYRVIRSLITKKSERGEYSAGWLSGRIRSAAIEVLRKASGKVLEVGCGEGLFIVELLKSNQNLKGSGIDRAEWILKRCYKRAEGENVLNRLELRSATGEKLPFADETFDFVVGINLIYNQEKSEARRILAEMRRVLKTGGIAILDFRNAFNPMILFRYFFAPLYDPAFRRKDMFLTSYTRREFDKILEALAMEKKKTKSIGALIPDAYLIAAEKK